jgi:uncharacterized membrane protein YagU involved in acid resistance
MAIKALLADLAVGVIGGYVGTRLMEPVSMKLYELESEADREQEDRVRPGPPYELAARRITALLGLELSDEQVQKLGTLGFHYGLGVSWGVLYPLLRRLTRRGPVAAGLLTGASLSLIVDEGLTPLFGFSAPDSAYPLATHLRGFAAHLTYALGVAATAEAIYAIGRTGGDRSHG